MQNGTLPTAGLWSATFQKRTSPRTPEVALADTNDQHRSDSEHWKSYLQKFWNMGGKNQK